MNININNETEKAFTLLNGTADNGDTYFQVYHWVKGVAIWGTVIKGTEADAQAELKAAMTEGRARKVAEMLAA